MEWHANAAALGALVGWLAGWWVPLLIRLVPEPDSALTGEGSLKEPYAEVAARPGLAWQSAIGCGFASGLIAAAVGSQAWLLFAPLVPVCVALTVIDWRTRLLPKIVVLPATAYVLLAGAGLSLATGDTVDLTRGVLGMICARALFWVIWRINAAGMGFGDVRLAAVVGFALGYLGWPEFVIGLYAGFLLLGVPGLGYAVVRRDRGLLRMAVPFGPFMLVGALVGILFGPIVARYLGYA